MSAFDKGQRCWYSMVTQLRFHGTPTEFFFQPTHAHMFMYVERMKTKSATRIYLAIEREREKKSRKKLGMKGQNIRSDAVAYKTMDQPMILSCIITMGTRIHKQSYLNQLKILGNGTISFGEFLLQLPLE